MKKKVGFGFTLVEMLIVVVILGILGSAILPRITGYLEKTRDLKRHADLRNIATAVEAYRNAKGELPLLECVDPYCTLRGDVSRFKNKLKDYISEIPKDPQKNNMIEIHFHWQRSQQEKRPKTSRVYSWRGIHFKPGEYLYQLAEHKGNERGGAFLVAKVETADAANYILKIPLQVNEQRKKIKGRGLWTVKTTGGGRSLNIPEEKLEEIMLCSSIKKGEKLERKEENGKLECTYTDSKQLYYILKIE